MFKYSLFLVGITVISPPEIQANTLVGVTFSGDVYAIDPADGSLSSLHQIPSANALTDDGQGNFVTFDYAQNALVTYDVVTGGVLDTLSTDIPLSPRGLTRGASGNYYALLSPISGIFDLYSIDGQTGASARIGPLPIGTFGQSLTIDALDRLVTFSFTGLVEIDPVTAMTTLLFPLSFLDRQTLFSDSAGNLYAGSNDFYRIDPFTGTTSFEFTVSPPQGTSFIRGAYHTELLTAPVPGPAPLGLMASAVVGAFMMLRRSERALSSKAAT
ncbi:MAG: hypothetical protein AAGF94_05635 [Pseudomonadota bacterium]